jgi:hypothetical protein
VSNEMYEGREEVSKFRADELYYRNFFFVFTVKTRHHDKSIESVSGLNNN